MTSPWLIAGAIWFIGFVIGLFWLGRPQKNLSADTRIPFALAFVVSLLWPLSLIVSFFAMAVLGWGRLYDDFFGRH